MSDSLPARRKDNQEEPAKAEALKILEEELNEFFKDRAEHKAKHVADKPKETCSENRDSDPSQMSGCCMTGCFDCPWGYVVPSP